jgi:hypothetical protein
MHTEHLQNVRPGWIMAGWLVAVAVTSVVVFGLVLLGFTGDAGPRDTAWALVAVTVGFLVGGWFTGYGTQEAPILHGVAMGLTSLVVWLGLNLVMVMALRGAEWEGMGASAALAVILMQIIAAVIGCRVGAISARQRAARLSEAPASGVRDRTGES